MLVLGLVRCFYFSTHRLGFSHGAFLTRHSNARSSPKHPIFAGWQLRSPLLPPPPAISADMPVHKKNFSFKPSGPFRAECFSLITPCPERLSLRLPVHSGSERGGRIQPPRRAHKPPAPLRQIELHIGELVLGFFHSPLPPMGPFRPFPATMGQDPTPRTPQQPRPHGASLLTHPAPPLCQGKFDNLPKPVITPYLLLCMRNCRQELLRALSA